MRLSHLNPQNKARLQPTAWFAPLLLVLVCVGLLANSLSLNDHFLLVDAAVSTEIDFDASEEKEKEVDVDDDKVPHQHATLCWHSNALETIWHESQLRSVLPLNPPSTPPPELV